MSCPGAGCAEGILASRLALRQLRKVLIFDTVTDTHDSSASRPCVLKLAALVNHRELDRICRW